MIKTSCRNVTSIKHTASAELFFWLVLSFTERKNFMSFSCKHVSVLHLYLLIFNTQRCVRFKSQLPVFFFLKCSQNFANFSLGILTSNKWSTKDRIWPNFETPKTKLKIRQNVFDRRTIAVFENVVMIKHCLDCLMYLLNQKKKTKVKTEKSSNKVTTSFG